MNMILIWDLCRFIKNPEFVKVGARILFREGRTKGIGKVTQVFPFEYKEADRYLGFWICTSRIKLHSTDNLIPVKSTKICKNIPNFS